MKLQCKRTACSTVHSLSDLTTRSGGGNVSQYTCPDCGYNQFTPLNSLPRAQLVDGPLKSATQVTKNEKTYGIKEILWVADDGEEAVILNHLDLKMLVIC